MALNAKFILGLLLYVVSVSTLIGLASYGMGYENPSAVEIDYNPPSNETALSWLPFGIGEGVTDAWNSLSWITAITGSVMGVLFWTLPETIFPLWANILFIKLPLIALLISIVDVLLP